MYLAKKCISAVTSVAIAGSVLLSGCSSAPSQNTASAAGSTPAASSAAASTASDASGSGPITVQFWYGLTGALSDTVQSYVKKFNESQNKIVVKATSQGDYYAEATKLQAAIVAKNQPDMAQLEISSCGQFGKSGQLADLKALLSDSDIAKYQPGLMKNSTINGQVVAVPFNRSTPVLYVNKDLLKAAGLNESGPKNWDELKTFAAKLTNKSTGVYGYETPIDIWFYQAGVAEAGGQILDDKNQVTFDNDAGTAVVQLWQDMAKAGTMKVPTGKNYDAWDKADQDYINQKAAMILESTGGLSGFLKSCKFNVGTAFIPADKTYGAPTGGANLAIMKASSPEKQKACAEFIKFLAQKENAANFSKDTGYMPATTEAVQSDIMQKLYQEHPQYKTALDQLQYAVATPITKDWTQMSDAIQDTLLQAMLDPSIAPATAVHNAAQKVKEIADKQS